MIVCVAECVRFGYNKLKTKKTKKGRRHYPTNKKKLTKTTRYLNTNTGVMGMVNDTLALAGTKCGAAYVDKNSSVNLIIDTHKIKTHGNGCHTCGKFLNVKVTVLISKFIIRKCKGLKEHNV